MYRNNFNITIPYISLMLFGVVFLFTTNAYSLKISEFYRSCQVGEWIEVKSSDGIVTKTIVTDLTDDTVTLQIATYQKKNCLSVSKEIVDVSSGKILKVLIKTQDGRVKEVYPDKELEDLLSLELEQKGKERIRVPAGIFDCEKYRTIYNDTVIDVWITQEVPIIHIVKVKMRGLVISLLDFGNKQS
ncbi:hypothetical protein ACFL1T_03940 [Chlamydiota bacterium]